MTRMNLLAPLVTAAALASDQLAKSAAFALVASHGEVPVAPFLTITSGMNRGIAFGLATRVPPFVLVAVAAAISIVIILWIRRSASRLRQAALAIVLGGALGNIVDRLRFGAVRDFIDFHWGAWHWPTFNLGDAFIAVGVGILVFASDSTDRHQPSRPSQEHD